MCIVSIYQQSHHLNLGSYSRRPKYNHLICIVLKVTDNFPSALQDSTTSKPTFRIVEVPLDLLIPLISIPPTIVPSWNHHIDVYGVFGFANKYMERNGTILIFHVDDPCVLKEIKSFLDTNGYEIHSNGQSFILYRG